MQLSLSQYLRASIPLPILQRGYVPTECACFHAFVTDETKRGKAAKRQRVKFYICPLHRDEPAPEVNIDLESVPLNFPLSKRNAFRQRQRLLVKARVEKLQAMKNDKEAMAAMDALAAELNAETANDNEADRGRE